MKLSLGYTYNLKYVEEIVAKDSILSLDEKDIRCQKNPQYECKNKKFINALRNKCHCLPFSLRFLAEKVCNNL